MQTAARLGRLRSGLGPAGCDALLVTNLVNIRYLTGFTGSAAMLLVKADRALLVTDGRYAEQSRHELQAAGVQADIEIGDPEAQRRQLGAAAPKGRIGLEAGSVAWSLQRTLAGVFADAELVATDGVVEELRAVKDPGELHRMEVAAGIADEALAQIRTTLTDLQAERELGVELDFRMRRLGARDVSFETIVASGPNGARPHARPSDRRIQAGELIVLDFGALVDGYHSDMTRTVCVGEPASAVLSRMVRVVAEAQRAGVAAVRAGVATWEVDAACRAVIAEAGWADAFVHGTGHGVGLDIHEHPLLSRTSTATLADGFVVTVEPGVYLPEHGGVRIEDTVLVTADGCRPLTHSPKDLVIA